MLSSRKEESQEPRTGRCSRTEKDSQEPDKRSLEENKQRWVHYVSAAHFSQQQESLMLQFLGSGHTGPGVVRSNPMST